MKKRFYILGLIMAAGCAVCCGCHKECHCYGYDGTHHFYTQEEVNAADKSCSQMVYQIDADIRYYSYCEWDY